MIPCLSYRRELEKESKNDHFSLFSVGETTRFCLTVVSIKSVQIILAVWGSFEICFVSGMAFLFRFSTVCWGPADLSWGPPGRPAQGTPSVVQTFSVQSSEMEWTSDETHHITPRDVRKIITSSPRGHGSAQCPGTPQKASKLRFSGPVQSCSRSGAPGRANKPQN